MLRRQRQSTGKCGGVIPPRSSLQQLTISSVDRSEICCLVSRLALTIREIHDVLREHAGEAHGIQCCVQRGCQTPVDLRLTNGTAEVSALFVGPGRQQPLHETSSTLRLQSAAVADRHLRLCFLGGQQDRCRHPQVRPALPATRQRRGQVVSGPDSGDQEDLCLQRMVDAQLRELAHHVGWRHDW